MDINKTSFYPLLPDILHDIATAHFVAIDLELSGVPVKQNRAGRRPGRQTLQERYAEVKSGAERFHILQFGLTCVHEDVTTGKYICKPYNIDLSPLIDDQGLGVEREFAYSSSAVSFLHKHAFDFSKPFNTGVQYLSREETQQARETFASRQSKDAFADMEIKDTDVEAHALLTETRRKINKWLKKQGPGSTDYFNIGPAGFDRMNDDLTPLPEYNRFQKRLIHQLIRSEYPQLVSMNKRGFIQVIHRDEEREARVLAERTAENTTRIKWQKGFRWVIEALQGKDISALDLNFCTSDPITGEDVFVDMDDLQGRFQSALYRFRGKPRVLVGHNCFLDLVYIYHSFIGPLPTTVQAFSQRLSDAWPVIVDTKYMATHNCGDINPSSSLEEIARELRPLPGQDMLDVVDEEHNKYIDSDHFHEAGFDSLLTAQIAIRLSCKLQQANAHLDDTEESSGGVSIGSAGSNGVVGAVVDQSKSALNAALSTLGLSMAKENTHPDMADDQGFVPSDPNTKWNKTGDPAVTRSSGNDPFASRPGSKFHPYEPTAQELQGIAGGMPRFDSEFWKVYGNRLRIFGTQESLLVLDKA